jgi:RNA polymerase sigma factor (sigma-70 family)
MCLRHRIDRLFQRYAVHGDVRALGAVFDATAPELLRIACHLVGNQDQAQDLVQDTFLIAIDKRREFAIERRVLPWLCGILVHLARNAQRAARRHELALRPVAKVEDPAASAAAAEFRAALLTATAALPAAYRSVMALHLQHGMNAVEISSELGRPAGTVRTQLVRGLDLLRRRLPRGFALAPAVVMPNATMLRRMRTAVMHRATETAAVSTSTAVSANLSFLVLGASAVKNHLAVIVGLAAMLTLGGWLAFAGGADPSAAHDVGGQGVASTATVAVEGPAAPATTSAPGPAMDRRALPTMPIAASGSLAVQARWRSDGAPASAQVITVLADGTDGRVAVLDVVTDDTGSAAFATLPPGMALVQSSTGARADAAIVAGACTAMTLTLDGTALAGRVVDHRGEPVADADVWVSSDVVHRRIPAGPAYHGQHGQFTLRTDRDGRFATRLTGRQCIAAAKAGYGPSLTQFPCAGRRPGQRGPVELVLPLLPAGGAIAVTVRGKGAAAVAGARILAGHEVPLLTGDEEPRRATTPAMRGTTDVRGATTLMPLPVGRLPLEVRAADYAPWRGEVDVVAGSTAAIAVELAAGAIVTGVVHDGDGKPLAGALVRHGDVATMRSSLAVTDMHGAYQLIDLPAGKLEVEAAHAAWGKVATTLVAVPDRVERQDLRLPARAAIVGRVFDADGSPAGGCYVTGYGGDTHATTYADTDGKFTLTPLSPSVCYSLMAEVHVRGGGLVRPRLASVLPGSAPVELRVNAPEVPTARLRGRVLLANGAPAIDCDIEATIVGESLASLHPIAADGTFELGPFRAGRVHLAVRATGSHGAPLAEFGVHELRDGETNDVGELCVAPAGGLRIQLVGSSARRGAVTLFRDGQFVDERLVTDEPLAWASLSPGAWAVCARRVGTEPICGFAEFTVTSGRVAEVTVAMAPAIVRQVRRQRPLQQPPEAAIPSGETIIGGVGCLLRATDASGRTVMMTRWSPESDGSASLVVLPTAATVLSAVGDGGRHTTVAIAGLSGEALVIDFERR